MIPAKKSLGQNFLVDQNIIHKIIQAIQIEPGETVVEIGPGQGALTKHLLAAGAHVIAIEKDQRMEEPLGALSEEFDGNLTIHFGDALETNFSSLTDASVKIVGNLPYNVGTPIVMGLLEKTDKPMTFMLQKEVVGRICAAPCTSAWGRLGAFCQLKASCQHLFDVPPGAFIPKPKVTSAIVQLTPRKETLYPVVEKNLSHLLHLAFTKRRKMLRSSLKGILTEEQMTSAQVQPTQRPEELSLKQLCDLANQLS